MLVEMLKKNKQFTTLTTDKQTIFAKLANVFEEEKEVTLFMSPRQLIDTLGLGNEQQWFDFLNMEPVRAFIRSQLSFEAEIAARQAFVAASRNAKAGDMQAVKIVNEMSGILNNADKNKVVVLHRISRPSIESRKAVPTQEEQT